MKIKIITADSSRGDAWQASLSSLAAASLVELVAKPLRDVNVLVNGSHPELVVAETSHEGDLESLEALATAHPEIDYVLVSNELAPDVLMRMMRAGVREVLPSPATPAQVLEAVSRLARKRQLVSPQKLEDKHGQVLSFISCKGGSGATFVAANLAHLLTDGGKRRVALLDLNLQFGDALLFVSSAQGVTHVADVAANIHRLDRELLQSSMLQASPGLWVLPAPDDPAQASEVQPEHVFTILKLAREMFDYVVIDAGRSLSSVTLQALDTSDKVYAVLQLTLPFIRDGKRLRDVFRSLDYAPSKIQWVVNRYQKDSRITLADLRQTLGTAGDFVTLPNQYKAVADSVNQGVPVADVAPGNAITKALKDFATNVAPAPEMAERGWFGGLFGGKAKSDVRGKSA